MKIYGLLETWKMKEDAKYININAETENMLLHEINIADNDVLIVEIPKKEEFVFTPNS
jgi:hypothetical protein